MEFTMSKISERQEKKEYLKDQEYGQNYNKNILHEIQEFRCETHKNQTQNIFFLFYTYFVSQSIH